MPALMLPAPRPTDSLSHYLQAKHIAIQLVQAVALCQVCPVIHRLHSACLIEFELMDHSHSKIRHNDLLYSLQVNGMVHRDIKLTNIGFPMRTSTASPAETSSTSSPSSTEPLQIKLGDFGMAGFVERG